MTEEDPQNPYTPTERADVDWRGGKRARKWPDGKTVMKQNAQGIFEYEVTVVSARYDDTNRKWLYKLLDCNQQPIAGETPEVELG